MGSERKCFRVDRSTPHRKGELQVLENNNGANSDNPQTAASTAWKAIDATTGAFITPDGNGTTANSIKIDATGTGGASGAKLLQRLLRTLVARWGFDLFRRHFRRCKGSAESIRFAASRRSKSL